MSITTALSNANSGLSAASRRASIVSGNIANALTPGYARRDVSIGENIVGGQGAGVNIVGVSRAANPAVTADRRVADGMMFRDRTVATAYAAFNDALGEPGDPFSLFTHYQNLESSLRALAQTPESQPLKAQALDAAKAIVQAFHQLSGQARSMRENSDRQIAAQVDSVNSMLGQIAELNKAISASSGRDVAALEDQRKKLIDEVSSIVPVKEVARGNGRIDLITNEGVFLIAGSPRKIDFQPANVITPASTYPGGLSGLTVEGANITPGSGSQGLQQGSLAGLFEVRDRIAPAFQTQIDALARDLIERFEGIDPTLAPGDPGLFTDAGAALDPAMELGLAGRIAINAAVDPTQGGALWRLRDGLGAAGEGAAANADLLTVLLDSLTQLKTLPSGAGINGQLSAADAVANLTSSIGAARISAETRLASNSARAQSLADAELAATGVDTDLEMQKLLLIEQAFAANARVIQTADEMMRTLMEL